MAGIRVNDIPKTLKDKQLKIHFSKPDNGGSGSVKKVYYPLTNNDAVVLFHHAKDVDRVMKHKHLINDQYEVKVQRLPENMIFSSVEADVDEDVSVLIQATARIQDELRYGADLIVAETDGSVVKLKGNWFQLEWAWHFLDSFKQQQEVIHSKLERRSHHDTEVPMEVEHSDVTREIMRRSSSPSDSESERSANSSHLSSSVRSALSKTDPGHSMSSHQRMSSSMNQRDSPVSLPQASAYTTHDKPKDRVPYTSSIGSPQNSMHSLKSNIEMSYTDRSQERKNRDTGSRYKFDTDMGLKGVAHKVPFESVHSTLGMENKQRRHEDENKTFDQFSELSVEDDSTSEQETKQRSVRYDPRDESHSAFLSLPVDINQYNSKDVISKTSSFRAGRYTGSFPTDPTLSGRDLAGNVPTSIDGGSVRSKESKSTLSGAASSRLSHRAEDSMRNVRPNIPSTGDPSEQYSEDQLSYICHIRGIKVIIYHGNLIKEHTDVIVNAANEDLEHYGGIAYAIQKARGRAMEEECREYKRKHGRLNATEVMKTSGGGEIKATHIFHAAGPLWLGERSKERVSGQLTQTFLNCFQLAEKLFVQSIALPAIGTGVYGVPLDTCVSSFLDAILIFTHAPSGVRHVHDIRLLNFDAEKAVMSIVLMKTLLEEDLTGLTKAALARRSEFTDQGAGLNLPRGRPERSGSFSKTYTKSISTDESTPKAGADRNNHRRSSSVDRGALTKKSSTELNRRVWDSDANTFKQDDSGSASSRAESNRVRPRTGSFSSSLHKSSAREDSSKATNVSKSKRPSTAESVQKSTPHIKPSLGMNPDRPKTIKSSTTNLNRSPRSVTAALRATSDYGRSSVTRPKTERYSSGRDYGMEDLHSLPADLNHPSFHEKFLRSSIKKEKHETCAICLSEIENPQTLGKCKHTFCTDCIKEHFKRSKPTCPTCGEIYGAVRGDQPRGLMSYVTDRNLHLPGYEAEDGTLIITYAFPPGIQEDCHPNPGKRYEGLNRKAYLPNSVEGREVLRMLRKAFDAKLVFTIGQSRTSGKTDVITWNDIHHKTSVYGGSIKFGYPDAGYLTRVKDELASKGITSP